MADAMKLVLALAKTGADKAGCDGWRAQEQCRQIVQILEAAAPPAVEGDFTSVDGLWTDQKLSRLDRVRAYRMQFGAGLKAALEAVDEEAARQSLAALATREEAPAEAVHMEADHSDAVEPLHRAIACLKGHVLAIQAAKARGGSAQPITACINVLPEIIRWLSSAEFEIEAAFEEYEDQYAQTAPASSEAVALTVWYGKMPESNGRENWTATLHRKDAKGFDSGSGGFCFARSEYPGRVLYEADRVRWIIGEKAEKPFILDYDADTHSGYTAPPSPDADKLRVALEDIRDQMCGVEPRKAVAAVEWAEQRAIAALNEGGEV